MAEPAMAIEATVVVGRGTVAGAMVMAAVAVAAGVTAAAVMAMVEAAMEVVAEAVPTAEAQTESLQPCSRVDGSRRQALLAPIPHRPPPWRLDLPLLWQRILRRRRSSQQSRRCCQPPLSM